MEKRERKLNNKGFSLVELIIVIAIMAILVGVVGTQVLPYMEKSRKAKDMQVVSAIGTAAVTTFAEHAGVSTGIGTLTFAYVNGKDVAVTVGTGGTLPTATLISKIDTSLKELLGVDTAVTPKSYLFDKYLGGAKATKLESKDGKKAEAIYITYDTTSGEVTVQLTTGGVPGATTNVLDPVTSK